MNAVKSFFITLTCISIGHYCFTSKLNIRKCKLTHSGIEYQGNVFITKFKSLCRPWNSIGIEPDSNFADGSRVLAKNFCRNPNGTRDDLWCYTYNVDSPVELCAVPLCNAKKCRLTGPGVEYGGNVNVTKSGYACSKWSDVVDDVTAADSKFPDGGRSAAGNRCRNPTGDPGGPWCYASVDGATVSDYCDISGCDDGVCHWTFINSGGPSGHGHYTAMPTSKDDDGDGGGLASFELKTWDPTMYRTVQPLFRMSLTAYPTGLSGDGFEVPVPVDVFARSGTAGIARVDVSWRNGFVVLTAGKPGAAREVSNLELNATLSPVTYLSFTAGDQSAAAPVAVRFAHCDLRTAGKCLIVPSIGQEEHVTNSQDVYRIFPLKKSVVSTSELSFSVRAVISATITYYTAPTRLTPCLVIEFAARPVQEIKIIYIGKSNSEKQLIFNQTYEMDVITYWRWHQYEITIADKTLQIQTTNEHEKNPTILLNITDFKLRFFHWFAIGSKTVAHWTLYCSGPEFHPLPEAALPECVISESSENYRGTQWITENGDPCLSWNISSVRKLVKERTLIDRSYVKAKNYCRNPTKDSNGPYCYVAVGGWENKEIEKRPCRIRKCRNTRCSMAGIATDYVGKLNKTLSNRTCLSWASHTGDGYAFPDGSALAASNYCRNPTREPTGAWCRVSGTAETDSCDVPGCSDDGNDDSDTLLIGGGGGVHWMHVLPDWRGESGLRLRLKRWAPGVYEGVSLRFRGSGHPSSYDLVQVGADGDEKIVLYRLTAVGDEEPDLAATAASDQVVYPHLLMASRWTELLFRLADGGHGADGRTVATVTMSTAAGGEIFGWTLSDSAYGGGGGRIAFLGLSAITGRGYVAAQFPTGEDCLIHSSESQNFSVFLPINVRSNRSLTSTKPEIVFRVKHTGVTCIALTSRKLSERHVLEIDGGRAVLWNEAKRPKKSLGEYKSKTGAIFTAGNWTRIVLSWNESVLRMNCGGVHVWHWTIDRKRPLLVRYFSVANRGGGRTEWTVNCDEPWRRPPDVDGPPRDGGWGEWGEWERCTKSCGGGTGVRSRRCDSPRPNVPGRPCAGPVTAVGACNQHECGQVSDKTAAAVRRSLAGRAHNAVAAVGDRLTLLCDPTTVDAIRADSPRARFSWLRNGKIVTSSTVADVGNDSCALVISSCTVYNSGVYAFVAEPPNSERIVLKLFAVAINDKPISVYIGDVVSVQCNAATLSYLFNRLSQEWLVNDSYVIKNYGVNSLASIDVDTITIENIHFQGIWKCVVKSTEINSSWVTNVMEIKVIGLSTRWTQIMQDPIIKILFQNSSPTMIISICTILISALCVGTWCCAYIFNKWRKQIMKKKSKRIQIKDGTHKRVPYQRL